MFFGLGDRLKLTEIAPGSLLLENRRVAAAFDLLFMLVFFGVWYASFGGGATDVRGWFEAVRGLITRTPIVILFLAVPLTFVPHMGRKVQVIFKGSRLFFDGAEQRIRLNDREVARFKDVARIRVSKIRGHRGSVRYALCLDLKDRRRIEVDKSGHSTEYLLAANAIARVVHAEVVEDER